MKLWYRFKIAFIFSVISVPISAYGLKITHDHARLIGQKIWFNECNNSQKKLTWWNTGEACASLGIGHFIWYPQNADKTYTQTFPDLIRFLASNNVNIPPWLLGAASCPWKNKEDFFNHFHDPKMIELRNLLVNTVDLQAQFIVQRFELVLPKILAHANPDKKKDVEYVFYHVSSTPQGLYAMLDYLNFKGDGTNLKERHQGLGWGLLQVLEHIDTKNPTLSTFAQKAKELLTLRVQHAPAGKPEGHWLAGWLSRVDSYLKPS